MTTIYYPPQVFIPKEASHVLRFASTALCDNKEVVTEILREDGGSLKYASERLQNEASVVLAAVNNDFSSIVYAGKEIQEQIIIFLQGIVERNKKNDRYKGY